MKHRSTKLLAGALIGLCAIAAIAFYFLRSKPPEALTAERVVFLVTEMTKTPERQQEALDELVERGDQAVIFLLPYLDDRRTLATTNIKFINSSPKAPDKYFLTLANSVDEVTLRYLCWHTESCDFSFEKNDHADRVVQLSKLANACRARYPKNGQQCRAIVEHKG